MVPFYTRVFSPKDYGTIDILTIFSTLVNLTIALEITQGIGLFLSDAKDAVDKKLYSSTALWFSFTANSFFLIICFFLSGPISGLLTGASGNFSIFRVALFMIWSNGLFYFLQNQLRWEMKKENYSVIYAGISIIATLVSLSLTIFFVLVLRWGVAGAFSGTCAGNIIGIFLIGSYLHSSFGFYFKFGKLKQMLAYSMPLVPSSIGVFVALYIDRIAIKQLMTMADVGLYGVGYRIASIASLLMFGFQGALTPLIYSQYKNGETPGKIATIFRMFLFCALGFFIFASIFAKEILRIFTAPSYYGAHIVVPLLFPAIAIGGMYIFAPGLGLARKTKTMALINILVAVANTILNFIFIPFFGIAGAALATMFSSIGGLAANVILGNRYYKIPFAWHKVWLATLIASSIVALGLILAAPNLLINYLLKGMLLIAGCVILGLILIEKNESAKAFSMLGFMKSSRLRF